MNMSENVKGQVQCAGAARKPTMWACLAHNDKCPVIRSILLPSFFLLLLAGCGGGGGGSSSSAPPPASTATAPEPQPSWGYVQPADLSDGWPVSNLAAEAIDDGPITDLMVSIVDNDLGIDAVSIARNGSLVLDELVRTELAENDNEAGNTDLNLHAVYSVTKSFNATLVGIAIDQGLFRLEDTVLGMFPQYDPVANPDMRKSAITVENFLTMQHGFNWDELTRPYGDPENSLSIAVENCTDYVACLLDLPMLSDPGTAFAYSTHVSMTLGAMVEDQAGLDYELYMIENLLNPLQITDHLWAPDTPAGRTQAGSGLFLSSRDMTKLGQLYLDSGRWNGSQVVSESWVTASVTDHVDLPGNIYLKGYGFQWWTYELSGLTAYAAVGFGGQYVIVIPDEKLVVTFTSRNYDTGDDISFPLTLVVDYVLPAINRSS